MFYISAKLNYFESFKHKKQILISNVMVLFVETNINSAPTFKPGGNTVKIETATATSVL